MKRKKENPRRTKTELERLGVWQRSALAKIGRSGSWSLYDGVIWGTRSESLRILVSLKRRGLVRSYFCSAKAERQGVATYKLTEKATELLEAEKRDRFARLITPVNWNK
jgi:hypothetical protein